MYATFMSADFSVEQIPLVPTLWATGILTALCILVSAPILLSSKKGSEKSPTAPWYALLAYLVFLALVITLAVTSFGSILQVGHMGGYAMLMHVTAAGAFVFGLVLIALFFLPWQTESSETMARPWWFQRWTAWAMIFSCIVTAATMFLSMVPLLDTAGLEEMLAVHRLSGMLAVAFTILHAYATLCTRLGLR